MSKLQILPAILIFSMFAWADPPSGYNWNLVFSDHFNTFDTTKWVHMSGQRPCQRDYSVHARSEKSYVADGMLCLATEKINDSMHVSGGVKTHGKFDYRYGYIEARIKVPNISTRINTAFWTMPNNSVWNVDNSGADGAEIDILETPYSGDTYSTCLHWDGYAGDHHSSQGNIGVSNLHDTFHLYGMYWDSSTVKFYVDNVLKRTYTGIGVPRVREFIYLTIELQQGWADLGANRATTFPGIVQVDSIAVWQVNNDYSHDPDANDKTAPSTPSGLSVKSKGDTWVWLKWNYMGDNFGIQRNRVFVNGVQADSTDGANNCYINNLCPGTQYTFTLKGVDLNGNTSAASSGLNVTTTGTAGECGDDDGDDDGPTQQYGFENNGNDAIGSNNAALYNGANYSSSVKQVGSYSLNLDGSNDYAIMASTVNPGSSNLTVAVWVYVDALPGTGAILGQQDGSGTGRAWMTVMSTGELASYLGGSGLPDPNSLPMNQWVHVAVTYDGSALRLYKNGSQVASSTRSLESATGNMVVGIHKGLVGNPLDGKVDDLRIYNRALSSKEISNLYSGDGDTQSVSLTPPKNSLTVTKSATKVGVRKVGARYYIDVDLDESYSVRLLSPNGRTILFKRGRGPGQFSVLRTTMATGDYVLRVDLPAREKRLTYGLVHLR